MIPQQQIETIRLLAVETVSLKACYFTKGHCSSKFLLRKCQNIVIRITLILSKMRRKQKKRVATGHTELLIYYK